jgi:hypothetical protein
MSDDFERRVRDALRAAPLPPAPDTLRAAMRKVASTPPAGSRWPGRRLRVVSGIAVAAAVVVVVAGIAGIGGLGRVTGPGQPTPGTTTGPMDRTPGPAATPSLSVSVLAPPSSVHVLDPAELRAAIAAQQAGGLAPQVVVAGVDIIRNDLTLGPGPATRECADPIGSCAVIGSLAGLGDPVTIRTEPDVVPPPITLADLRGPVAIRLAGSGPIEYLGHVDVAPGTGALDVPALLAATSTAAAGRVVAVTGWLEGSEGLTCGLAPPDTVPEPFRCAGLRAFISADPVKPMTVSGSQTIGSVPASAVRVQYGAYDSYAPSPASDGINAEPRLGLYLVRAVVAPSAFCPDCRGWLVVGRLDAAATAVASPSALPSATVRSADELEALLATNRDAWVGKPVLVDGRVVPGTEKTVCIACDFGTLDGTTERVFADAYTASLLLPDTNYPTNGVMAFTVRADGLEYIGYMGSVDGSDYVATLADLQDPMHLARGPETFIVSGWLVEEGPIPCPAPPSPFPPQDTPFETCPAAWLTQDEVQPVSGTATWIPVTEPANAIRVQWGAYGTFAPDPSSAAFPSATEPRFGTYLVRLVTNTAIGPNGPRGWQVVARLAP